MKKHRRRQHRLAPPSAAPKNRAQDQTDDLSEDEEYDLQDERYCLIEPISLFPHTRLYKAIHNKNRHITLWDEYNGNSENHY